MSMHMVKVSFSNGQTRIYTQEEFEGTYDLEETKDLEVTELVQYYEVGN